MILYHNNRCSKSREALAFLQEKGIEFKTVAYLTAPLSEKELRELAAKIGVQSPREMMRTKEALYRELNLKEADDDALFAAMANHPVLMERPILDNGSKAAIGRPLENLLAVLS